MLSSFRKDLLLDARPPLTAPPPLSAPSARVLPAEESAWDIVAQHAATSSAFGGGSRMLVLGGKQDARRPNSSIDLPALRQTPVRTVAGAQFRGYGRAPAETPTHQCAKCAEMNSKLHRVRAETSDAREQLEAVQEEALASSARLRELEASVAGLREELVLRTRQLYVAREGEQLATAGAREIATAHQADFERFGREAAAAAHEAAELQRRLAEAHAENGRLANELEALRRSEGAAAAVALAARQAAEAEERERREREAAAARACAALEEERRRREHLAAEMARWREMSSQREAELETARRDRDLAEQRAREHAAAAAASAQQQQQEQQQHQDALTRALDVARTELHTIVVQTEAERRGLRRLDACRRIQHRQRSRARRSALASVLESAAKAAKAEAEAEAMRARVEHKAAAARAEAEAQSALAQAGFEAAAAERAEAKRLRDELSALQQQALLQAHQSARADEQRRHESAMREAAELKRQSERERTMKEVLSAIKIAVLAPCLKLHVNGLEPRLIGSPGQINFERMAAMLEAEVLVLVRASKISLLNEATPP
ncbi:hypothetical protein Ctob_001431 [Chrysochromulina tobinii]|uniref:Uncharacterized protein n=1 Tax=Chrysochromulina tobinii TaxID=1460289 RepID=A0A0M0J3K0_9EUKA|nr:hypothetical protein Ctob_001431 [Chrysochromulina tobinii]|eukprot:KOO21100.1 hypothetical protein Ctob_001431 [Chrysochromulina sp. CCMP291]